MNREDRSLVESFLKQTLYSIANQFLSTEVTTDIENEESIKAKNLVLEKAHNIIDKEVPKVLTKLEKKGITKLEDFEENKEVVGNLLDKLERKMRENAEELSKTGHKETRK